MLIIQVLPEMVERLATQMPFEPIYIEAAKGRVGFNDQENDPNAILSVVSELQLGVWGTERK